MTRISHALIVSQAEIDALLSGEAEFVFRWQRTSLRMPIGLLRADDNMLIGTAELFGVEAAQPSAETAADGRSGHAWRLRNCRPLDAAFAFNPSGGPLWARLDVSARQRLEGGEPIPYPSSPIPIAASKPLPLEPEAFDKPQRASSAAESLPEPISASDVEPAMVASEIGVPSAIDAEPEVASADVIGVDAAKLDKAMGDRPVEDQKSEDVKKTADAPPPPTSSDSIATATTAAMRYVPDRMISVDEAHGILVQMRDEEIKHRFPDVPPEFGILRRSMLHALLDEGVATRADYFELVSADLRRSTHALHMKAYLDPILAVLTKVQ